MTRGFFNRNCTVLLCCLFPVTSLLAQPIPDQASELASLKKSVAELQQSVETLKKQVWELTLKNSADQGFFQKFPKVAEVSPDKTSSSVLNPELGQITVSFKKIKPYATGSEFTLEFVNVSSITLTNVNFEVFVYRSDNNNDHETAHLVSNKHGLNLPPGRAVNASFRVPSIKPDNFKYAFVRAEIQGMEFYAK